MDHVQKYYLDQDFNCAETVIRIANEQFDLGIPQEEMKLLAGFGGGLGCGMTCGALCGGIAAISKMLVEERAHATEGFKEICADYVSRFEQRLGNCNCAQLKESYFVEENRCLKVVEEGTKLMEEFLRELSAQKSKT